MNMIDRQVKWRKVKNDVFKGFVIFFSLLATLPLVLILFYILRQGFAAINWSFLTNLPKPVGESGGGILNAIAGTLIIVGTAAVMAIPVGVLTGIYLNEQRHSKVARYCDLAVDVLQGIPSIVIGIIIYEWVVRTMGSFSAFSGSAALALMMLPFVAKTTQETLKLVPHHLKEASLALGVPYYKTVLKVMVPAGLGGILSGAILGIARVIGETAPLLFTAFGNPFMSTNLSEPMSSLPLVIFNYAASPYEDWHQLAWGASLILILIVLTLNMITKFIEGKWKIQF